MLFVYFRAFFKMKAKADRLVCLNSYTNNLYVLEKSNFQDH